MRPGEEALCCLEDEKKNRERKKISESVVLYRTKRTKKEGGR